MAELENLQAELARRNTCVHELHLARIADQKRIDQLHQDIADFAQWLQQAEDERERLKARVTALETPETPRLTSALRVLQGRPRELQSGASAPKFPECADGGFLYHFHKSPYRVFREPTFLLAGWAFPQDGRPVTALRARVDDRSFSGTYGLAEPEVIARFGGQPENPRPGFKMIVEMPPGRHRLSLEARLGGDEWFKIVAIPIWAQFSA